MRMNTWLCGAALLISAVPVGGQSTDTRYTATRLEAEGPSIDGNLEDAVWVEATWDDGFLTAQGGQPTQDTRFAIVFDDHDLYVGIRLGDTAAGEIARVDGERDDVNGDRIAMFFDTDLDPSSSFVFVVNAAGVVRDQRGSGNNGPWDMDWNSEWDAAVQVDDGGWTAEFRIPLTVMDVSDPSGSQWGLQFTRVVETREETIMWSPVDQTRGWTASFGRIGFDAQP